MDKGNGHNAQIEDFLEQLEKFINNLMSAVSNMEGQITLEENGIGPIIDNIETPADYQSVGKFNLKQACVQGYQTISKTTP